MRFRCSVGECIRLLSGLWGVRSRWELNNGTYGKESYILRDASIQEVISHYIKSELARIFNSCHEQQFWTEFNKAIEGFLNAKSSTEIERLVAALAALYRENAGLYRKFYDKNEPLTTLPNQLSLDERENLNWYYIELPISELKFPNLPKEIMPIIYEVDRDIHRFINWVNEHPGDSRVVGFRADIRKPMPYKEIIAIFRPHDLPADAAGVDFWIVDGVHRLVYMARQFDSVPLYLGVPKRHKRLWRKRYKGIIRSDHT